MPEPLTRAEVATLKAHLDNWRPGRNGELHPVARDMARLIESYEAAMTVLGHCSRHRFGCVSFRCSGCKELLKGWRE